MEYPVIIGPLSEEDGGGYMGYAPDLIGCMSDGETPEEAISNTYDAIAEWLDAARKRGIPVPLPGSASARERLDKEQLVKTLRSVTANAGLIDERLQDLERAVREIEQKLENQEEWTRFASLTGIPEAIAPGRLLI